MKQATRVAGIALEESRFKVFPLELSMQILSRRQPQPEAVVLAPRTSGSGIIGLNLVISGVLTVGAIADRKVHPQVIQHLPWQRNDVARFIFPFAIWVEPMGFRVLVGSWVTTGQDVEDLSACPQTVEHSLIVGAGTWRNPNAPSAPRFP